MKSIKCEKNEIPTMKIEKKKNMREKKVEKSEIYATNKRILIAEKRNVHCLDDTRK